MATLAADRSTQAALLQRSQLRLPISVHLTHSHNRKQIRATLVGYDKYDISEHALESKSYFL